MASLQFRKFLILHVLYIYIYELTTSIVITFIENRLSIGKPFLASHRYYVARYLNDSYRLCDRRGFGTWPPTQPRQTPLRIKGNLVVTNDSFVYTHVTHRAHHRIIEGSTRRCPKIENQILSLDLSRFQSTVRNLPILYSR